jgi:Rrf2 family iron-sulfur cluster assembly transcriptional regulator
LVSKTALHAIRALCALAKLPEGERAGAAFIADAIGAPPNYLGKLLQNLSRQGLVESKKGLNGGFRLARPPESITLKDVVDPIDQVGRWSECLLGMSECSPESGCVVHDRWGPLRDGYLALLQEISIADLVGTGVDLSGDFLESAVARRSSNSGGSERSKAGGRGESKAS